MTSYFFFPDRVWGSFFYHRIQTDPRAHIVSYPVGTESYSHEG